MLVFFFFLRINLTINVAHPVFLMHTQTLLSGYAPGVYHNYCQVFMKWIAWGKKLIKNNINIIQLNKFKSHMHTHTHTRDLKQ